MIERSLSLALARAEDINTIVTLWRNIESWAEESVGRIWHNSEITEQVARFYVEQGELYTLTDDPTGCVIGTITLTEIDPCGYWEAFRGVKALYVQRVALHRAHAGRGLGQKLLKFSEQIACSRGRRFLRLDCDSERPELCRIYEEFGFERVGSAPIAGFDAVLYEKDLIKNSADSLLVQ